jgi:hypothetical protein
VGGFVSGGGWVGRWWGREIGVKWGNMVAAVALFWFCAGMNLFPAPSLNSLSARLAVILTGLCGVVAACGGRRMLGWDRRPHDPAVVPLIVPIWGRLSRLRQRFARLVARVLAGRMPRVPAVARVRTARVAAGVRLPAGYGWLLRMVPDAVQFGAQFQALLDDPEIGPALVEAPGAGRVLRPLCKMLGVPVPVALGGTGTAPESRVRKAVPAARPMNWAELIASKPVLADGRGAYSALLRKNI